MVNLWSQIVLLVLYLLLLTISSLNYVSSYGSKKFMKGLVIGHMLGMKKSHFAHYPHYHHPPIIAPAVIPPAIAPPVAVATPTSFGLPMAGTSAFSINAGMTTGFGLPGATALTTGISPFALVNPALVNPAINPFGTLGGFSINPFALGTTAISPFAASTTGIAPAANIFVTG